ncbi:HPP family protein [Natronomonas halophila]|uniref:HPP family protein n=1 Tax=Natronomonas halophila TaxID=2747817 RepID=UPI0015B43B84|nr:HPP family protein [Natronomonas halophila]QLD86422.1 HPP family protein [Natronomonas halophila]
MPESLRDRIERRLRRLPWFDRRPIRLFFRRLEETNVIIHVSMLVFVPSLVALLTYLSNHLDSLSFFVFPPLAAGTYALFSNPEGKHASPVRFVGGLTAGALCSWVAILIAVHFVYPTAPPSAIEVDAPGAAFAVLLTGALTWALDIEEATAFAVALLGLLVDPGQQAAFVISVFLSSTIVAGVFAVWRSYFYEQRARYLYRSTKDDDRVLVPMRGEHPEATAMLGARLAAAHDAGKVVLLDVASEEVTEDNEGAETASDEARAGAATAAVAAELEALGDRIETTLDVPCQVVVVSEGPVLGETIRQTAAETNCDIVAVPYEASDGELASYIRRLMNAEIDVLVHRTHDGRTEWNRVMVPVRRASDTAHAMIDFALRLVGSDGHASVARCIDTEKQRRSADEMLANLVGTADGRIETRVINASFGRFLRRVARTNDLIIIGSSRDRSRTSRLISPPTFEHLPDVETDIAIVDRR